MENVLNDITSLFNSIISLVANLFAFLPDWCIAFASTSFLFVIGIFVYRLLRG